MGSDRIDRLNLCPYIRCVPPVVELDAYTRMVCYPFADQSLRGRVAAMAVHDQDALEPVVSHRIKNVAQNGHIGLHSQRDRSGKRPEIRCDAIGYDGKYRNA